MQRLVVIIESPLLVLLWTVIWAPTLQALYRQGRDGRQRTKRGWNPKPRTPEDCPTCRLEQRLGVLDMQRTARPWREVKSRQGHPKTHETDGHACMEPGCENYKDPDGTHHALRWDGTRNKGEATPHGREGKVITRPPGVNGGGWKALGHGMISGQNA